MKFDRQFLDDADFWHDVDRNAVLLAIEKCEDAAKQVLALTSTLSTLYLGLIIFNDTLKQVIPAPGVLFFLVPLPFWIIGLMLTIEVILPRQYALKKNPPPDDENSDEPIYRQILDSKRRRLRASYILLAVGMVVLILVIGYYLACVPLPSPEPTPLPVILITP